MTELPTEMSDDQRAFVQAVEALGATSPAAARPLAELPRISTRELLALEKSGLIREADDGVYLFRARPTEATPVLGASGERGAPPPVPGARVTKSAVMLLMLSALAVAIAIIVLLIR